MVAPARPANKLLVAAGLVALGAAVLGVVPAVEVPFPPNPPKRLLVGGADVVVGAVVVGAVVAAVVLKNDAVEVTGWLGFAAPNRLAGAATFGAEPKRLEPAGGAVEVAAD